MEQNISRSKEAIHRKIQASSSRLIEISHQIHANPELAFEEYSASKLLSDELESYGFALQRGVVGLDTAFVATIGTGPLVLSICAEYDALPEVGHACGHNIIAAAAIGAAKGLLDVIDEADITLKIMGTPAEENGGGRLLFRFRSGPSTFSLSPWVCQEPRRSILQSDCRRIAKYYRLIHNLNRVWSQTRRV